MRFQIESTTEASGKVDVWEGLLWMASEILLALLKFVNLGLRLVESGMLISRTGNLSNSFELAAARNDLART